MANYSLFGAVPPTLTATTDPQPVNLATAFYLTGDLNGWRAAGARFYMPDITDLPTTGYKAYLWVGSDASTATLLRSADFGAVSTGWNQVLFETAATMDTFPTGGKYYWISVYFPAGGYGVNNTLFQGDVISPDNTNLRGAWVSEVAPGNGSFGYGAPGARPATTTNTGAWYGVDVVVDDGVTDTSGEINVAPGSVARIIDTVEAVRTGGPNSLSATATATDQLGLSDSAVQSLPMAGSSFRTMRKSMWEDRVSLGEVAFSNASLTGPAFDKLPGSGEIGLKFHVQRPVRIVAVKVHKAPAAAGNGFVTLWDMSGNKLAETPYTWVVDAGGWREYEFLSPVAIPANASYIVSYYSPDGNVSWADWIYGEMTYFEWPFVVPPFTSAQVDGSVLSVAENHSFPTYYRPHNYYVEPVAEWEEQSPGFGPGYYEQFPNGQSSFDFPIAVFYPDPPWLSDYVSVGVNTMCGVPLSEAGYREAILAAGCDVYASTNGSTENVEMTLQDALLGPHVKGYFLHDEPDMVHHGAFPAQLWDETAAIRRIDSTRPIVLNLGQWPVQSVSYQWWPVGAKVELVTPMWREFAEIPDVLSCDFYNINKDPRLGIWTYAKQVQKMKQLCDDRLPIWVYVESCPVEGNDPSPAEVKRATWAGLIAGATGVVFFDHRFVNTGYTQDFASLLHTPDMRQGVTELCAEIQSVAAALKATPLDLVTSVTSTNTTAGPLGNVYGVPIAQTSREAGAYRYVFAQADRRGATSATFTVPSAANKTITVLGESRTLTANGSGVFTDSFDNGDYAYHLYRWTI